MTAKTVSLFYTFATTAYLSYIAIWHVFPRASRAYQRLWIDLGIVDEILLYRWSPRAILDYCDTVDITVTFQRFTPFMQIMQRPATGDEKIRVVGAKLVASTSTAKAAKRMRERVARARELAILESPDYKQVDMQRTVENIWNRGRK